MDKPGTHHLFNQVIKVNTNADGTNPCHTPTRKDTLPLVEYTGKTA